MKPFYYGLAAFVAAIASLVYFAVAWYWYVAVVLAFIGAALFITYRGFEKVRAKPYAGIPGPPMTHPVLGHVEYLLNPHRHLHALKLSDSSKGLPLYQLAFMKQNSVVITDAKAAAEVLRNADQKISEINQFRFDPTVPDLLASEGADWDKRSRYLRPALEALRLSEEVVSTIITQNLKAVMRKYEQSKELLNMHELSFCLSFDILCKELCSYDLLATADMAQQDAANGEGAGLFRSLKTLIEAQTAKGLYASTTDRKVSDEEIAAAKSNMKNFFNKITDSAEIAAKNAPSLKASESFAHVLINLTEVEPDFFSKKNVTAEIGQCVRHGQDALLSTICWAFYALSSNFEVRAKLENEIRNHKKSPSSRYPEYLECFVLEVFRRYPAMGNQPLRTSSSDMPIYGDEQSEFLIPAKMSMNLQMWSLHNTIREWDNPEEFNPERWMKIEDGFLTQSGWVDAGRTTDEAGSANDKKAKYPQCPFMKSTQGLVMEKRELYEGVGYREGAISFLPFSAGKRSCPVKNFVVDVVSEVLYSVCSEFRLDHRDGNAVPEAGILAHSCIMPYQNTIFKVSSEGLGCIPKKKKASDEGWATNSDEEDDDEEVPALAE